MTFLSRLFLTFVALLPVSHVALTQDALTMDQKVNETFATFTGPFVGLIFAPIPGTSFPWIVLWLVVAATIFTI